MSFFWVGLRFALYVWRRLVRLWCVPAIDGQQIATVLEEVATPPADTLNPVETSEVKEKGPFGRGLDKGLERLGEDVVAEHLPKTAKAVAVGVVGLLGIKYTGAASLVQAVIETLLAFLA